MPGEDVMELRRKLLACWAVFVWWLAAFWMLIGMTLAIHVQPDLVSGEGWKFVLAILVVMLALAPFFSVLRIVIGLPKPKDFWTWIGIEKPSRWDLARPAYFGGVPPDDHHPANKFWSGWFYIWITFALPFSIVTQSALLLRNLYDGEVGGYAVTQFLIVVFICSLIFSLWGVLGHRWLIRKYKRQAQENPA